MIVLNSAEVKRRLKSRGFHSLGELCASLELHRNSLSSYLSGKGVLPLAVQKLFDALDLEPGSALERRRHFDPETDPLLHAAPVLDALVRTNPNVSFILFGSRARNNATRYSDIDIGVLGPTPLSIDEWVTLREVAEQTAGDLPYAVDVVDLGRADPLFLQKVRREGRFAGGSVSHWTRLQRGDA